MVVEPETGRNGGRVSQRILGLLLGTALAAAVVWPTRRVEDGPVLCPFRLLTGLPCPFCGLTRSWVHTAHGDVAQGFVDHPVGPVLFALTAGVVVWILVMRARAAVPRWLGRLVGLAVVAALVAGSVRLVLAIG